MKKKNLIVFLLFMSSLVISCSNNNSSEEGKQYKREGASSFDTELVNKITGVWQEDNTGNQTIYGNYTISEKDEYIFFKNDKLKITSTEDNEVLAQTEGKNPCYYDFKVNENDNKLTVFRHFSVPDGVSGGVFAPIYLVSDASTTIDFSALCGEWVSTDEEETYFLSIEKISSDLITYTDNLENINSTTLKIEEISNEIIKAFSEDESTFYSFSLYDGGDRMTAFSGVNPSYYTQRGEDSPEGTSKPIEYKKVVK